MSSKPIFLATHPRACSTVFERIFLNRDKDFTCFHEPLSDAYYYGPERISKRFDGDEKARLESGRSQATYDSLLSDIREASLKEKRVFVKEMAQTLMPLPEEDASKVHLKSSTSSGENPTILSPELLDRFDFTFLIRHPRSSVPSYYKCSTPPMSETTGWHGFRAVEVGYHELRVLFDYLKTTKRATPCLVDADDFLHDPEGIMAAYCKSVNVTFDNSMLQWGQPGDHEKAETAFEKFTAFHTEVLKSNSITRKTNGHGVLSDKEQDASWTEKFGSDAAKIIRDCVDANVSDFMYLKQFAIKAE